MLSQPEKWIGDELQVILSGAQELRKAVGKVTSWGTILEDQLIGRKSSCDCDSCFIFVSMKSQAIQSCSIAIDVRPVSRFLRLGLASSTAFVLGGIIFGFTRAMGMFAALVSSWFQWRLVWFLILLPLAFAVGIAAAAYPRRWLSSRRGAFIVAAVGAATGILSFSVFVVWMIREGYTGQLRYGWRELGTILPLYFILQIFTWLIAVGPSAMLVTLTRRTPAVLVSVAALCLLAVVLPAPVFNFATNNQELTVAFVIPASPDAGEMKPPRIVSTRPHPLHGAEANAGTAHVLEALRKAGFPGPYRVAEIDRCGTGKKALQIIVLTSSFLVKTQLPQPDGTELIYVSQPDGWRTVPEQAPTLGRNVEVRPGTNTSTLAMYWIHAVDQSGFGGGIRAE